MPNINHTIAVHRHRGKRKQILEQNMKEAPTEHIVKAAESSVSSSRHGWRVGSARSQEGLWEPCGFTVGTRVLWAIPDAKLIVYGY